MTNAEARLVKMLRDNILGTSRIPLQGKREENAARELEKHGLVRFIEGPCSNHEAEWAGRSTRWIWADPIRK